VKEFERRIAGLSRERLALLCLELEDRLRRRGDDDGRVAVLGLACRFPGAGDAATLWRNLEAGVDAVTPVPAGRWHGGGDGARYGGFLRDVDRFDAAFFRVPPREAESMDPQQRLLLETAWRALEDAQLPADALRGSRTGVFVGVTHNEYATLLERAGVAAEAYQLTGNPLNFTAGRLAFFFDFRGPAVAVDSACSSSLVAVHLACRALRAGECDLAVAAGVNLVLTSRGHRLTGSARLLAPDGRCKTFDAAADGIVRGEGVGVVVLSRLDAAVERRDPVRAVILGSAVNQDGATSGITVPNRAAQRRVIRAALADAGTAPERISYLEAHGTGTPLGDPIELGALADVFGVDRPPLALGSVKTNLGHLESAAGVAGLVKTVLQLEHRRLAPSLHFARPTPEFDWQRLAAEVVTEARPWPATGGERVAGVSAFGGSGTNAHLVVAEGPEPEPGRPESPPPADGSGPELYVLSARTAPALERTAAAHAEAARSHAEAVSPPGGTPLGELCAAVARGRTPLPRRRAVVASSLAELARRLEDPDDEEWTAEAAEEPSAPRRRPRIAFLFTGQGAQYPGMAAGLMDGDPLFRETVERLDAAIPEVDLDAVFRGRVDDPEQLARTDVNQLAAFALGLALDRRWRGWGIEPDVVLGHSVGEITAACACGALSLEDGVELVRARVRAVGRLPEGAGGMLAVEAPASAVRPELGVEAGAAVGDEVVVAALNGPRETVVSGPVDALDRLAARLSAKGVTTRRLRVSHPFHHPSLAAAAGEVASAAARLRPGEAVRGWISTVTGDSLTGDSPGRPGPEHWRRHLLEPVRFDAAVRAAAGRGCTVFVELGARPVLLRLAKDCLAGEGLAGEGPARERRAGRPRFVPSLTRGREGRESLLAALGALFEAGVDVDWGRLYDRPGRHLELPGYPFECRSFWVPGAAPGSGELRTVPGEVAAGEVAVDEPSPAEVGRYEVVWRPRPAPAPASTQAPTPGRWLLLADDGELAAAVAAAAEERGYRVTVVVDPPVSSGSPALRRGGPAVPDDGDGPSRVVVLEGHGGGADPTRLTAAALAALDQTPAGGRLVLVTRGGQPVGDGDADPAQAALWGLGRVIGLEEPERWGGLIDLDPDPAADPVVPLVAELAVDGAEDQVAYRGGVRKVARLVSRPLPEAPAPAVDPGGWYLLVGGHGGVGRAVARWLVDRGARRLILAGRTPPERLPAPARAAVDRLRGAGAEVELRRLDVADGEAVTALVAELAAAGRHLAGVAHLAVDVEHAAVRHLDHRHLERALGSKLGALVHLDRALAASGSDGSGTPPLLLVFSSAAGVWGSAGLGHYAAASQAADAFAHNRRRRGLPTLAVAWGPWDRGAMNTAGGLAELRRLGVHPLATPEALGALGALMAADPPGISAVAKVEWHRFAAVLGARRPRPLLEELAASPAGGDAEEAAENQTAGGLRQRVAEAPPEEGRRRLRAFLRRRVAAALGVEAEEVSERLDPTALGLDSLMVMEVVSAAGDALGLMLFPRDFFDHPSIESLAGWLHRRVAAEAPPAPHVVAAGGSPADVFSHDDRVFSHDDRVEGLDPVFLLSSPRSGSTLLRVMLAGHPRLFCPPELHLLGHADMAEWQAANAASDLTEGLVRAVMELTGEGAEEASARVAEWVGRGEPVARVYGWIRDRLAGRTLVDKSPSYATSARTLERAERLFADPHFVHLVRHPHAVIDSFAESEMQRLLGLRGDPFEIGEQLWTLGNANLLELAARVGGRCRRVRFEELVREPEAVSRELCDFLGVDFHPALLEPYQGERMADGVHGPSLQVGDPLFAGWGRIEPERGERWRRPAGPPLGRLARALARDLGYRVPDPAPAEPPATRVLRWAVERYRRHLELAPEAEPWRRRLAAEGLAPTLLAEHGVGYAGAGGEPVAGADGPPPELRWGLEALGLAASDGPRDALTIPVPTPEGLAGLVSVGADGSHRFWPNPDHPEPEAHPLGLDRAREAARRCGFAVLVPSPLDVLRARALDFEAVVLAPTGGELPEPARQALGAPEVTLFSLAERGSRQHRRRHPGAEELDSRLLGRRIEVELRPPAGDDSPLLLMLPDAAGGELPPIVGELLDGWGVAVPHLDGRSLYVDHRDGPPWGSFLVEELLPHLARRFPSPGGRPVALLGLSMGGLGVLRLAFAHPRRFAAVSALAPAVEPGDRWAEVPRTGPLAFLRPPSFLAPIFGEPVDADGGWSAQHPPNLARAHAGEIRDAGLAIELRCGTRDPLAHDGVVHLHRVLEGLGVDHRYRRVPGGRHDRRFFATELPEALGWLAEAVTGKACRR